VACRTQYEIEAFKNTRLSPWFHKFDHVFLSRIFVLFVSFVVKKGCISTTKSTKHTKPGFKKAFVTVFVKMRT